MRRLLLPLAFVALFAAVVPAGAGELRTSPPNGTQEQVSAEMPVPVPDTKPCVVKAMEHLFANSYGAPFNGTISPPKACPGPWGAVVLNLTSVVGGVQFDRDVYVAIGHAVALDGTTSEPCCVAGAGSLWSVDRDITDLTPLLLKKQPVQVELDNVNDKTYTGVYKTSLTVSFYPRMAKAGPHTGVPDRVLPISSRGKGGPMLPVSKDGQRVGGPMTFPRNLTRLHAQVFADSHGACEEFWWGDPGQCAGNPYRELAVYVDGKLAGAAPAYPGIYTGAGGPGLWEPIPAPRTWNLRPYDLDLTPFVGLLTNGKPHAVQIGVLGTKFASGDFWQLAANLLCWTSGSAAPTTGHLLQATAPATATASATDPTGQGAPYADVTSHSLTFVGDVVANGKKTTTTVTETMGEDAKQAVLAVDSSWTWAYTTKSETGGHVTQDATTAGYALVTDVLTTYQIEDSGSTSRTVDGKVLSSSDFDHTMRTADATGLVINGADSDEYRYEDSAGACYHETLGAQAGQITVNLLDTRCRKPPV